MIDIAPSILAADFANLQTDCERVINTNTPWLHFDVMDGIFVPNISIGLPVLDSLKKAIPSAWFDVHLMIQKPHLYVEQFAKAGADIITFHFEAESPIQKTATQIKMAGAKAGISIRPKTPVEEIFPVLKNFDFVLVMSVEPGFGGQSFMPESLKRIAKLKEEIQRQNLQTIIEVDGGINLQTGKQCVQAGAQMLVAGSAVFKAEEPLKMMQSLQQLGEVEHE